jgi:hypothetical protein
MAKLDSLKPVTEEIEVPSDNLSIDEWTWLLPEVNGSMKTEM